MLLPRPLATDRTRDERAHRPRWMPAPVSIRARAALGACALLAIAACTPASRGSTGFAAAATPSPPTAPAAEAPQEICSGQHHTCVRRGKAVACWGDNTFHQVAPSAEPQLETPRIARELPPATALRCGAFETCVLTAEGGIHCLGGPGRAEALPLEQPARDVALGANGGCALLRDGTILCWARPPADDAGPGPTRFPRAVAGPRDATGFVPAPPTAAAFCLRRAGGSVACLAAGGAEFVAAPIAALGGAAELLMARASGAPLCARFPDGRVACADPGVPGLNGAPLTVPPDVRLLRLLAPRNGGFCGAGSVQGAGAAVRCLGDPTPLDAAVPPDATQLAFSDAHACAIVRGTVQCWGAASYGQLGAGGSFLHPRPIRVTGVADAVQLDASAVQVCALRRGGGAVCWGQLVDGSARLHPQLAPEQIEPPPGTIAMRASAPPSSGGPSAGRAQPLCARVAAKQGPGRAAGWRCLSSRGWEAAPPPDETRSSLAGLKTRQISRDGHCGVSPSGHLVCVPMIPVGTTRARASAPVVIEQTERFVAAASGLVDGGRSVVCGLTDGGRVACFHLEGGRTAKPADAPSIAALTGVEQIAAGGQGEESLACARTSGGAVACWGDGRYGQLGPAAPNGRLIAVAIAGLPPVAELAVGGTFACARTSTGDVYCWGSNRDGAVPEGAAPVRTIPVTVAWPSAAPARP